MQRQIGLLGKARQQAVAFVLELSRSLPPMRLAAGLPIARSPPHHLLTVEETMPMEVRHLLMRQAVRYLRHNALSEVERIGSSHACWLPPPASSLNQSQTDLES
jgi:hypothetical protein